MWRKTKKGVTPIARDYTNSSKKIYNTTPFAAAVLFGNQICNAAIKASLGI